MAEVKRGLHNVLRCRSKSKLGVSVYLTTTPTIEGKPITRYCGVVAGEAILGTNIFRDMLADIRDIVGGRSATYERALREARKIALDELQQQARALGANAVVGIDLDYETIGTGMLMVSASGTAVRVSGLDPAAPAGSFARAQMKERKDGG